jgi:hypothetical protein
MRWVLCWYGKATVNRRDAGSIPASAALTNGRASRLATAAASKAVERQALGVRLPLLPLKQHVLLAERQRFQSSKLARRVRLPQGTLGIWVGSSAAEQVLVKFQRAGSSPARPSDYHIPGSSLLVVMPGFEPGVRRFDSYPRNFANPNDERVSLIERNDAEQLLLVVTPGSEPGGRWFDSNFRSLVGQRTEVIRLDEEPVLKTGGRDRDL